MDLEAYLRARQLVMDLGGPINYLILALAAGLIVVSLVKVARPYRKPLALATFLSMLAGYLMIAWFHLQIYLDLSLNNPTNGQSVGRWAIPLWVEGEKFYFWALLLGLLVVLSRRQEHRWRSALYVTFGGFAVSAALFSNPFANPLPGFHGELSSWAEVLAGGNLEAQMQEFGRNYGRLVGFYNSVYMWIHPPLLFLAYATFVVSFLGCVFMLLDKAGGWEKVAYDYAKPGYIVLTVGILLGYPWAVEAWGDEPWWYSPKINVTLMMWVLYTAYLHSRIYLHRRGMRGTVIALGMLAFLAVAVTYVTTYLLPGVHSVAGPQ